MMTDQPETTPTWPPRIPRGLGWRPEIDHDVVTAAHEGLIGFTELIAEGALALPAGHLDIPVIPHGVGLSLGSADEADLGPVNVLADAATRLNSPLVSEHVAFVRGGGLESGHLLPCPRTPEGVDVVVRNINTVTAQLPVRLAIEMPATLFAWPDDVYTDAQFVTEVLDRADVDLMLDVANVYANAVNTSVDPRQELLAYPLERIAYCHIAGGRVENGTYIDSHVDPVWDDVFTLLSQLPGTPPTLLERDGNYPTREELLAEVAKIHPEEASHD